MGPRQQRRCGRGARGGAQRQVVWGRLRGRMRAAACCCRMFLGTMHAQLHSRYVTCSTIPCSLLTAPCRLGASPRRRHRHRLRHRHRCHIAIAIAVTSTSPSLSHRHRHRHRCHIAIAIAVTKSHRHRHRCHIAIAIAIFVLLSFRFVCRPSVCFLVCAAISLANFHLARTCWCCLLHRPHCFIALTIFQLQM